MRTSIHSLDIIGVESFLQQEYGKYEANLAVKEYELAKGIKYKYKIRSRFDLAYVNYFPNISSLTFDDENCSSIVYYPNRLYMGLGAEDSFNFGLAEAMDPILDRYMDLIAGPVHNIHENNTGWWNSEAHLVNSVKNKQNLCLLSLKALLVSKMRTKGHKHSYETHLLPAHDWVDMNQRDGEGKEEKKLMFNPMIHVTNITCMKPGQEEHIVEMMRNFTAAAANNQIR
jgi:hypothetical protein